MDVNNSHNLNHQLGLAYQALNAKQLPLAIKTLKDAQREWPRNADIEHLLALSYKAQGDWELSEQHFRNSLSINDKQPEVYNNLANLLKSTAQYSEAEQYYCSALSLQPTYLAAQRNLAICYQSQGLYTKAATAFGEAIKLSPNDVSSITGLADCQRLMDDLEAAHSSYKKALSIDPKRAKSWHNFGLNHHLQGQLNEAIDCYQKAHLISPGIPEIVQSLALSLYERGEITKAIELFSNALNQHPGNIELHERFNNMLWETEYASQFGASYEAAMEKLSNVYDVALSYASILYRAGRTHQAKGLVDGPKLAAYETAAVLSLKGQIDAEFGDYQSAYALLGQSLALEYSPDVAQQMVKLDIIQAQYRRAQNVLDMMFANNSNCQMTWGLQSIVWRLCDDPRYHWLCDYDTFIGVYQLPIPNAYANLDDFLSAIRDVLQSMHRNDHEPLEQTLRNGTQTAARLLHSPNLVLQQLKDGLSSIVSRYIADLPSDAAHPLLSRKTADFDFSGSWSVRLRANGFHVNHVHPDGWISSSCYITIPSSMLIVNGSDASQTAGHIKFGESPLQLGDREVIERTVEPEPGMVVLFPSYFWHGTVPFDGGESDFRLTSPFDIVPKPEA